MHVELWYGQKEHFKGEISGHHNSYADAIISYILQPTFSLSIF